jgi:glutamate 5-kinase
MKKSLRYRSTVIDARRIVIKLGTGVLTHKNGRPDIRSMRNLVSQIAKVKDSGYEIVVVTSGAIGTGMEALGMKTRPTELPDLQMAAAVGQARLMSRYEALFARYGYKVGQVLLTHMDFHHKIRLSNIRRTMANLLRHNVIPIVNENDVVADEEIKADLALGDNDLLAALLVRLIRADLLILLTTTDGLRAPAGNHQTRRIPYIEKITPATFSLVRPDKGKLSKGGMASKLKAAQSASSAGCATVIANGRKPNVLKRILAGEDEGTLILAGV